MSQSSLFLFIRNFLIGTLALLASIAVLVPLNPLLPSSGLDPSWVFTLNEAVAKGWVFGRDIIFTFGPYASIYSKTYHPGTDPLMLWGSLLLSLCYAISLFLLAKTMRLLWTLAYVVFITGFLYTQDVIFFSYLLILILVIYRFSLLKELPSRFAHVIFPACFLTLGLLPIVKGSFLPICSVTILLCALLLWHGKYKILAYTALFFPIIGGVLFWIFAGQPLSALPAYFINMSDIISGYTEAMAVKGNNREIILYVFTSAFILCAIALNKFNTSMYKYSLIFGFAFFLFAAFKIGFIRHDAHAAVVAAPFIVIVALLLMTIKIKENILITAIILSIVTWGYIDHNHLHTSTNTLLQNALNSYSNIKTGLKIRFSKKEKLKNRFQKRLQGMQQECPLIEELVGSSDIYSYRQSQLLSAAKECAFRPIFQSYSAYTPKLAQFNENYIRTKHAPDNILFRLEPIDGRLPSLEDGFSWPILIQNYSAEKIIDDLILLKKKATIPKDFQEIKIDHKEHIHRVIQNLASGNVGASDLQQAQPFAKQGMCKHMPDAASCKDEDANDANGQILNRDVYNLEETVILPEITHGLFAKIELNQTLLGKIRSTLFKPTELYIHLNFINGKTVRYRFISTMARSRFLISPLVETASDFFALSKSPTDGYHLKDKLVKSFRIEGNPDYWNKSYKIELSTIHYDAGLSDL